MTTSPASMPCRHDENAALEFGRYGILTNAIARAILTPMVAEAFNR